MAIFGNNNSYVDFTGIGNSGLLSGRFQLTEAGTVTQIHAYLQASGTKTMKAAIYDDSGGQPNIRKGYSGEVNVSASGWYDFNVSIFLTAGWYHLCVFLYDDTCKISYLAASGTSDYRYLAYGDFPDPYGAASDSTVLSSIYATYTAGQIFTKNPTTAILLSSAIKRFAHLKRTISQAILLSGKERHGPPYYKTLRSAIILSSVIRRVAHQQRHIAESVLISQFRNAHINRIRKKISEAILIADHFWKRPIFKNGFEQGNFTSWDDDFGGGDEASAGCTAEVIDTDPHHGTYHAHFVVDDTPGNIAQVIRTFDSDRSPITYARFYVKFKSGLPENDGNQVSLCSLDVPVSGGVAWCNIYNDVGTVKFRLRYTSNGDQPYILGTTEIQLNVWYCVELYAKTDATAGQFILYINGSPECTTASNLNSIGLGHPHDFVVGEMWANLALARDLYIDCVVIDHQYIGPEAANQYSRKLSETILISKFLYVHTNRIRKKISEAILISKYFQKRPIFKNGFEQGNFTSWTSYNASAGCTAEVIDTDPHHGTYHAHFLLDGDNADDLAEVAKYWSFDASPITYGRFYVKFKSGLPANNGDNWTLIDFSGTDMMSWLNLYNNAGTVIFQLHYTNGGANPIANGTTEIQLNVWYCVEIYNKIDATAGQFIVYLNGNPEITTASNLDSDGYGNPTHLSLGTLGSNVALASDIYVDCVVIDHQYIGPEIMAYSKTLSETILMSKYIKRFAQQRRSIAEEVLISRAIKRYAQQRRSPAESILISRYLKRKIQQRRTAAEAILISQKLVRRARQRRTISEKMLLDSTVYRHLPKVGRRLSETILLSRAIYRKARQRRSIYDRIIFKTVISKHLPKVARIISKSILLSTTLQRKAQQRRFPSERILLKESLYKHLPKVGKIVSSAILLSTYLKRTTRLRRTVAEAILISRTIKRYVQQRRILSETFLFKEALFRGTRLHKTISETILLKERGYRIVVSLEYGYITFNYAVEGVNPHFVCPTCKTAFQPKYYPVGPPLPDPYTYNAKHTFACPVCNTLIILYVAIHKSGAEESVMIDTNYIPASWWPTS